MRERKHKDRRLTQRPFDIDIVVPGFAIAAGRTSDRVRCSAETRNRLVLRERRAMVADLGRRLMHNVLVARLNGQFTTEELELAYKQGTEALRALARRCEQLRLDLLLSRWAKTRRIRTSAASREHVRSFVEFCGGNEIATTAHLTPERIEHWLGSLQDQRRGRSGRQRLVDVSTKTLAARKRRTRVNRPARPLTGATRNRYRASMSAFCTFLVDTVEVLPKHPIRGKVGTESEPKRLIPNVSAIQWASYLDFLSSDPLAPPHSVLIASLLRYTGADIGEILGFMRRDNNSRVRGLLASSLIDDPAMPRIQFKRQKVDSSKPREVPCPRAIFDEVRRLVAAENVPGDEEIFAAERERFECAHKRARSHAGLGKLRIKDLRHLAAIAWVRGGIPLTKVQKWLGHASIQQTAIYADFAPDASYEGPLVEKAFLAAHG